MYDDYDDEVQEEEKEWRKEYKTAEELLEDIVEVKDRWEGCPEDKIAFIPSKELIAEGVLRAYQLGYEIRDGMWATQSATIAATNLREFAEIYIKEVHGHELMWARLESIEEQPLKPGVLSKTSYTE